jgi:hypothetical protein
MESPRHLCLYTSTISDIIKSKDNTKIKDRALLMGDPLIINTEAHDKKKVGIVIDGMLKFSDTSFPSWRKTLEGILFTVGDTYTLWRYPEDERVDVQCPTIEQIPPLMPIKTKTVFGRHKEEELCYSCYQVKLPLKMM